MHHVGIGHGDGEKIMHMRRKTLEARLIAHEAMDEDKEEGSSSIPPRFGGHEGLG